MVSKNCVKISFKGLTHQIVCDEKFQYDELLNIVMDKFKIENSFKLAIEFYDEQGHKFNKDTFEYLMLLFPHPQKIFFIRMDSTKIPNNPVDAALAMILEEEHGVKVNNKQTTPAAVKLERYGEAVPVRRQNCFLGEMPGLTITQKTSLITNRIQSNDLSSEMMKRMKCLKQSPAKKKNLNNPNHCNRSLRI